MWWIYMHYRIETHTFSIYKPKSTSIMGITIVLQVLRLFTFVEYINILKVPSCVEFYTLICVNCRFLASFLSQIHEIFRFQGNWQKVWKNTILRGFKTAKSQYFQRKSSKKTPCWKINFREKIMKNTPFIPYLTQKNMPQKHILRHIYISIYIF